MSKRYSFSVVTFIMDIENICKKNIIRKNMFIAIGYDLFLNKNRKN
jgi:hypothetical protein